MVNHHVPAHPAFGVADESTPGPVGVEGNSGAPICDSAKAAKIAKGAKIAKSARRPRAQR